MSKIKPRLPKGTRDFLPEQVSRRRYLLGVITDTFRRYGFQEIETPAMEMLETLTGKYGEEGEKLLFRILNSGDFLAQAADSALEARDSREVARDITEKGLRYDLTVPLARYAVQHRNDLVFPFRRFHVGPVWRADRPQKGRYREFYQCDADVIGSDSLLCEAELTAMLDDVFRSLGMEVRILVNHRQILEGIVETAGMQEHYSAILIAVDKMDKIGADGVRRELAGLDLSDEAIDVLFGLFGTTDLDELDRRFTGMSKKGRQGVAALKELFLLAGRTTCTFAPGLARGLDYYTGTIWEVQALHAEMGTIAAGGRYDELTEMFGGSQMSGVGISFGVERIYDVLEAAGAFPADVVPSARALVVNFGNQAVTAAWKLVQSLRASGIATEIYPDEAKLKKQLAYADRKGIPYVVFVGEEELEAEAYTVKDMASGEQQTLGLAALTALLRA